jgi:hypothetical protein
MWDLDIVRRKARKLSAMVAVLIVTSCFATTSVAQSLTAFVVKTDLGGQIGPRAIQISKMRIQRQKVEITGRFCLSSCTMFLGAGDVCIDPKTVFGFHGPSNYGLPLRRDRFEYWSTVVASHYSAPLRDWYMQTARYTTSGFLRMSGAQLIQLGYLPCQPQISG